MKIYLISGLFILIGDALSQGTTCQLQLGLCFLNSMREHGIPEEDINEMSQAGLDGTAGQIIPKLSKDNLCAQFQFMQKCLPVATTGECANDAGLLEIMAKLPMIKSAASIMGCYQSGREGTFAVNVNCVNELRKCSYESMTISEVTQNEIDSVLESGTNRTEQIDKIGKERGCKFVDLFYTCHGKIKNQCGADDPNFMPFFESIKMTHDQLNCGVLTKIDHDHVKSGRASAVASLILILPSIFLVFHQKLSL